MGAVSVTARAVADAAPELSLLQWRVLVVLADAPDGATVTDVAARIGSRLPATSRLLARLRTRGLIAARKDEHDGRVTHVALTTDGEALWRRVVERRRVDLRAALDSIGLAPDDEAVVDRLARAFEAFR